MYLLINSSGALCAVKLCVFYGRIGMLHWLMLFTCAHKSKHSLNIISLNIISSNIDVVHIKEVSLNPKHSK